MDRKKLMVIDGSSLIYRAFYALPLLSTKDGIYTNGVYGFLTMLYRVREEQNPEYICVAFDKKGPTFRHKEYKEYKSTRQKTPSELIQQFPIIREILDAMNIKYLEMDDYEADDIAGTLAKIGEEKSLDVVLVTGDKDYLQLATDSTKIMITKKGISEMAEYDRDAIIEEYGITPDRMIDLKGLMGDKSDNIPGVPGIGEKTGLKLLKQYEDIEEIYEHIDELSGKKLKENLIEHKSMAFLSRKLGEIITNVNLDIEIEKLESKKADPDKLLKLYEDLEFKSLIDKISGEYSMEEEYSPCEYNIIKGNDHDDVLEDIKAKKKFAFKFMISDHNYIEDDIIAVGIKTDENLTNIIIFDDKDKLDAFSNKFKEIFEDGDIEKLGHDLKTDIIILLRLGIEIAKIEFDSTIAKYIIDPALSSYTINDISKEYLGYYGLDEEELLGKGKHKKAFSDIEDDQIAEYLSFIVETAFDVEAKMKEIIKEQNMIDLYYEVELKLVEVLASMEYYGFYIDERELENIGEELDIEIESLTGQIHEISDSDFNINSPKQLGEVLFDQLELPVIKKTKTGYSTNAEVLDKLKGQHPIIEMVLRYRQIVKLKSTYIDGLLSLINKDTHRIHSSFNQTITTTGRISSTEPNLQNIPIRTEDGRKIRKAFVAKDSDHILVDADYSQIELRVLAHISGDEKFIEAFNNNEDIHTKTASEVFGVEKEDVDSEMRSRAKAVNFGIVYGISDYGLSRDLNIPRKESKKYIDNYLKNYKDVKRYMEDIVAEGEENGYVETILHRRRYIPELKAKNFNIRSFGERIAMNTPIQGSAADIIKIAMVNVYEELKKRKLKSKLILQIHDELIIEARKDEVEEVKALMKDIMENAIKLDVPLTVDLEVGDSWYDTK